MATVKKLRAEAICAICLDYFQDPVSIDCGHNFCRPCIVNCWEIRQQSFSCPQCRETTRLGSLRSNRELGNMVELVKTLRPEEAAEEDGGVCPRHREPLKLFCRQEEAPICVICRESREHRPHEVLPVEEAAEEYKVGALQRLYPNLVPGSARLVSLGAAAGRGVLGVNNAPRAWKGEY